jgi:predicted nucleotidyltransferase
MGKYEAKISEIREKIVKEIDPEKVILFGSYAWGTPTDDSDVDLLIIQKSDEPRRTRQINLRRKFFGSGVAMDFIIYTPDELNRRLSIRDVFVNKILNQGKVLYER